MPVDDPFLAVSAEQRTLKKPMWKDKLFSRGKNSQATTDQQVEAFLGPSRSKPAEPPSGLPSLPTIPPPPQLHFSSYPPPPSSHDGSHRLPHATPSPVKDAQPTVSFTTTIGKPQRSRKPKGLRVRFSEAEPEVMGEGGDETDAPTIEISRQRARAANREGRRAQGSMANFDPETRPRLPELRLDTSFGSSPGSHQAQSHGPRDGGPTDDWRPLLVQNPQDADFLMALSLGEKGSRLSFRASSDSNTFARRIRAKMQAEEGQALHTRYHEPPSPNDEGPGPRQRPPTSTSPVSPYRGSPISDYDNDRSASSSSNTFHSSSSPVMRKSGNASPLSPNIPMKLLPGGPAQQRAASPRSPVGLPEQQQHLDLVFDRPVSRESRESREGRETSRSPQPPKHSLRTVVNQFGESAVHDLKVFVGPFSSLFRLAAAESSNGNGNRAMQDRSLGEWVRAAMWWFLRGKTRLEAYVRSSRPASPRSGGGDPQQQNPSSSFPSQAAKQAVIDLGKALWIVENVVPQHPEVTRFGPKGVEAVLAVAATTGNQQLADLLGLSQGILRNVRSLATSIKKNDILTTCSPVDEMATRFDTSIWVAYPSFAPDVAAVLSGMATRSMLANGGRFGKELPTLSQSMPLSDNNRYFNYGSMFVQAYVRSEEDSSQQFDMPCSLSIVRDRSDWCVLAAISSQSELVNITIQSDRMEGPTWDDDVEWQLQRHTMRVKLPRHFELAVVFQETDFKMIWNIVRYTQKTVAGLNPEADEKLLFETTLTVFHYRDPGSPKAFPAEPIESCQLRLFERSMRVNEGISRRLFHQGFRLVVVTSPKTKTLSSVCHTLGHGSPIVFGLLRGDNGAPALLLKVTEDGRARSLLMTFHNVNERTTMYSALLGMIIREREFKLPEMALRLFTIEQPPVQQPGGQAPGPRLKFPASKTSVIDQDHGLVEHAYGPTVLSESLRVLIATEWGSVTDRINLGPGELKISVDVSDKTSLALYRPGQQDLTVAVAENLIAPDLPESLTQLLQTVQVTPMIRRFEFVSLQDLHKFQCAVTGYRVLLDSTVSSFSIARRRMVVPIYKKWEATSARIQIVSNEKTTQTQLLAFFSDFSHGKCMNFVLKGTDNLETFSRSGKFGIRIVDAKFALPKTNENEPAAEFVCLDMPDYAIEHDDVVITFDAEEDRKKFESVVPGSVREASRMGSLRR